MLQIVTKVEFFDNFLKFLKKVKISTGFKKFNQ